MLRPDTYIGSVEHTRELMWIYQREETTNEAGETVVKGKMIQKEISFVPGLYKIFDEILVNAADNKQRDKKMSCIRIDINAETNTISVWNNGQGNGTQSIDFYCSIFRYLIFESGILCFRYSGCDAQG